MAESVWVAIIGVIGLAVSGWFALKSLKANLKNNLDLAVLQLQVEQKKTHELVNSRMSELLELTRRASLAQGKLEEKEKTDSKE